MRTRNDRIGAGWARVARPEGRWLPLGVLLLVLGATCLVSGQRHYFYKQDLHAGFSGKSLALAANLGASHGLLFLGKRRGPDGVVDYQLYNRFPGGAVVLTKLAILPFEGDFSAQIAAARVLMLVFFCAAAVLAYWGLARLANSRAVALGAVLFAFSSYHLLDYSDVVSSEMSVDLFAVMLVFHGMVRFEVAGGRRRFWELAARVCAALLLGWHVFGLLLPFLAFGAAREAAGAWRRVGYGAVKSRGGCGAVESRAGCGTAKTLARRFAVAAAGLLLGRHALLGALAVLFGGGVLGWNLAQEHAALGGQRSLAELPSVHSMLKRTGLRETGVGLPEELRWPTFVQWQFHRVGAASLPFALSPFVELAESVWRASAKPWLAWLGVVAILGAFAGLRFFPSARAPPAALALAGFGWAYLASGSTAWAQHQFETMFHVGVPLCLSAAVLLGARRLWRPAPRFCAAAAVVLFAASGVAMAQRYHDDDKAWQQRAQLAEFDVVAKTIQGKSVWVAEPRPSLGGGLTKNRFLLDFFTSGSYVHYPETPRLPDLEEISAFDFVLAFERPGAGQGAGDHTPALLTPDHRFVFLYQAAGGLAALRQARLADYRRVREFEPVARSAWDIHIVPGAARERAGARTGRVEGEHEPGSREIAYIKAPCQLDDTTGRFFLHLAPADANVPVSARVEFERRDHLFFKRHGVMVDDKCLLRLPLPTWPVADVFTGQFHPAPAQPVGDVGAAAAVSVAGGRFHPGGEKIRWQAAFRLDIDG